MEEIGRRVDLVSYRHFGADLLALQLVASMAGSTASTRSSAPGAESGRAAVKGVRQLYDESPQSLKDLYADLDVLLTSSAEVRMEFQQHYIAYRRIRNVATVRFQPASHTLVARLAVDPDGVDLVEGFTRDLPGIGALGTGALEVKIRSRDDLARARDLVLRSVEGASR
ncbi:transporter [Streptomyces sp. NPDC059853]|uniref:transporter n=1 Tax=Streptomyces sp. NPDC059853 TaxID=3346973 RepID=UPI003666CF99